MSSEDFEYITLLGEGAFGKVHLVRCRDSGDQYAMKVIEFARSSKSDRELALQEADTLSKLGHPNILQYLNSFESSGDLCIVTEYCSGGDLAEFLKLQDSIKLPEIILREFIRQIASALEYLHKNKFIHRDVKTPNVFLTKTLDLKLGDMGLAKVLENPSSMAVTMCGSPYYMSPEIFQCKPYGMKSDIWALAIIVYELSTLERPFDGNRIDQLVTRVVHERPPAMPDGYDDDLVDLLTSMMQKDANQRPTASQILAHNFFKTPPPNEALSDVAVRLGVKVKDASGRDSVCQGASDDRIQALFESFSQNRREKKSTDFDVTIKSDTVKQMENILTHSFRNAPNKTPGKKSFKKVIMPKFPQRFEQTSPDAQVASAVAMSSTDVSNESGYNTSTHDTADVTNSSDLDSTMQDASILRSSEICPSFNIAEALVRLSTREQGASGGQTDDQGIGLEGATGYSPGSGDIRGMADQGSGDRQRITDQGSGDRQGMADQGSNDRRRITDQGSGDRQGMAGQRSNDRRRITDQGSGERQEMAYLIPGVGRQEMEATVRRPLNFEEPLQHVRNRVSQDAQRVESLMVTAFTNTSPRDRKKSFTDDSPLKKRLVIQIEHLQQYIIKVLDDDMGVFNAIKDYCEALQDDNLLETSITALIGPDKYEQIKVQLMFWRNFEYNLIQL